MTIHAAADGSALGNPGPAGWAWFIDDDQWAAGGWPHGTNNMGELMAVLDLLQQTASSSDDLHIYCDSKYVIDSITKWMAGWKRKGWKRADGQPVKNVELIKALDEAMVGRKVKFEWVKGHAGHALNERADQLANGAAARYQAGLTPEPGPGFTADHVATPSPVAIGSVVENPPRSQAAAIEQGGLFDFDGPTDEDIVAGLERTLARGGQAEQARLLHRQWTGLLGDELLGVDDLTGDTGDTDTEVIRVERLSASTILVVSRTSGGQARSSLWVEVDGSWRQRFSHSG